MLTLIECQQHDNKRSDIITQSEFSLLSNLSSAKAESSKFFFANTNFSKVLPISEKEGPKRKKKKKS